MGFGTNRVVGKQINKTALSSTQLKGMNMLKSICDVKKKPTEEKKEEIVKKDERKPNRLKNLMALDQIETKSDNVKSDLLNNE